MTSLPSKAFTLIELLIVVAIIAILAAIAVPNFLEAQTRSKVSRAKADMRTLATGLEAYYVDYNGYPPSNGDGSPGYAGPQHSNIAQSINGSGETRVLERLSTPIAYLTSGLLPDPFPTQRYGVPNNSTGAWIPQTFADPNAQDINRFFKYAAVSLEGGVTAEIGQGRKAASVVFLQSSGPDNTKLEMRGSGLLGTASFGAQQQASTNNIYDPTNGTVSNGSVFRAAGAAKDDRGGFLFKAVQQAN